HEMAHAEGHDESEARRREQALWTTFVLDQRIDQLTALRYLQTLSKRPDVKASATREPAIRSDSPADGVSPGLGDTATRREPAMPTGARYEGRRPVPPYPQR